jgi:hypothetical protein
VRVCQFRHAGRELQKNYPVAECVSLQCYVAGAIANRAVGEMQLGQAPVETRTIDTTAYKSLQTSRESSLR